MIFQYSITTLIIVAIALTLAYDSSGAKLRQILFGPVWTFEQVCGIHQDSEVLLRDDEIAEALFNGSNLLESRPSGDSVDINKANKPIYDSIITRNSLCMACSVNSWSYADKDVEELSNPTEDDQNDCECRIDSLLKKVFNVTRPGNRHIDSRAAAETCTNVDHQDDYLSQVNSFGRVPSGPMHFNEFWLGDYDTCTKMQSMRYCLGSYKSHDWVSLSSGREDFRGIRIGLCLPRTCGSESLNDKRILRKINSIVQSNLVDVQGFKDPNVFFLESIYCLPTDDSRWMSFTKDYMSIFLLLASIIWVKLLIYATVVKPTDALQAFDLNTQVHDFFEHKETGSYLYAIDAIKVISMIWIINNHNFLILSMFYMKNMADIGLHDLGALITFIGGSLFNQYWLITGFLTGLSSLQKERSPMRSITERIGLRYLLYAPTYIIIYAYIKKFRHVIGSGPLWDYAVSPQSETRQCMLESWLVPVLMLSNLVPPSTHCITTGSNVSNDFQIYILLLVLMHVFRKSRRMGRLIVIIGVLVSFLHRVWVHCMADNFSNRQLINYPVFFATTYTTGRMARVYVGPIWRLGVYFLGVLLADLVIESMQDKSTGESRVSSTEYRGITQRPSRKDGARNHGSNSSTWLKSNYILLISLLLMWFHIINLALPDAYRRIFYSQYMKGLLLPVTSLSMELGCFALLYHLLIKLPAEQANSDESNGRGPEKSATTQQLSCLGLLSNSKYWKTAAKLNYCIMLTHFEVIRYTVQTQRELPAYSDSSFLTTWITMIILSYLIGFITHITIAMPITKLLISLIYRSQRDRIIGCDNSSRISKARLVSPSKTD